MKKGSNGKKVIVRTYSAGVHYGTLISREGKEAVLGNARRLWSWAGAASLSQLAAIGTSRPSDCKFSVRVPEIVLTEAIEVITCAPEGVKNIEVVSEWKS